MRPAGIVALLLVLVLVGEAAGSWTRFTIGALVALVALVWLRGELRRDPGGREP